MFKFSSLKIILLFKGFSLWSILELYKLLYNISHCFRISLSEETWAPSFVFNLFIVTCLVKVFF